MYLIFVESIKNCGCYCSEFLQTETKFAGEEKAIMVMKYLSFGSVQILDIQAGHLVANGLISIFSCWLVAIYPYSRKW